ncbi:phosphotransferase family protein [Streptomyces sp. NPDC058471]|uniref:phosphotransferase family protein n=1 Tax=Streptomyces sp. NPDC058471 TaxID=3346516 RepID=UPI003651C7B9
MTERLRWADVPGAAVRAIEEKTGPIVDVTPVEGGFNSEIAVRVDTASGPVFVKGLRAEHPRVGTQRREAQIAALTDGLAPRLLWRLETAGWDLLGFEFVSARPADYSAGSPDVLLLADTLTALGRLKAPDLDLTRAEDRWRPYVAEADVLRFFAGNSLCHTDFNPENVLVADGQVRLADWAWATVGAPWIDTAVCAVWLIATGKQPPREVEAWTARIPAWRTAPTEAVAAFTAANAWIWQEIAEDAPGDWSSSLAAAATQWAHHHGAA